MNAVNTHQFDLALDDSNDIDLNSDNGSIKLVQGKRELAQKVSNLLNINLGEVSWNQNLGLSQGELLMNDGNISVIQSEVNKYLSTIFGNSFKSCHIDNYRIDKKSRTEYITLSTAFDSTDGPITVNSNLMIGGE